MFDTPPAYDVRASFAGRPAEVHLGVTPAHAVLLFVRFRSDTKCLGFKAEAVSQRELDGRDSQNARLRFDGESA